MKILKGIALCLLVLLAITGCDDDDGSSTTHSVDVQFAAYYDQNPLVMNQVIDYNGQRMRINVSEFYISDISLRNENNEEIQIRETDYVKFTEVSGPAITSIILPNIPEGTYNQLNFSIGVPADKNAMKPEDFSSNAALSNTSTYWEGWQSYIFSKLEGKLDTAGNGNTDLIFVYHSGKDELYTPVSITLHTPLVVDGQSDQIDLAVEHKSLFKRAGGDYLDIKAKPTAHNPDDLEYPTIILGNFKSVITID